MERRSYVDVDALQAQVPLGQAAAFYGRTIPDATRTEVRLDCPFACRPDCDGKREISVNTAHPQKVFYCHAYQCQVKGNLLGLMYGWKHGRLPSQLPLKGAEFNEMKADLTAIARGDTSAVTPPQPAPAPVATVAPASAPAPTKRNVPLSRSDNEAARSLATLDEKLVTDIAEMNPKAAKYVRSRPFLSPEVMRKWRMGYLPSDGGADKRGLSLRGCILYPMLSERGEVLCWAGRDPAFEEKHAAWERLPPSDRASSPEPPKYRFPKGYHRGLELFGQQADRLDEPGYREKIAAHGLIVVEGPNVVTAD